MSILLSAIDKRIWQTNGLTGVNCCLRNLIASFCIIKLSRCKIILFPRSQFLLVQRILYFFEFFVLFSIIKHYA